MIYPEALTTTDVIASIHGYFNPINLSEVTKWTDSASFIVNGSSAFMMRGCRGYISLIVLDDDVIFQSSEQFWSRRPTYPNIRKEVSPRECLLEFKSLIEMMIGEHPDENAKRALNHIESLILVALEDGYLPVPTVEEISPLIKCLVSNELLEHKIYAVDPDFEVSYGSYFMEGSLNRHQFFITQKFDGNKMDFSVNFTSRYHLDKCFPTGILIWNR